MKKLKVVTIVGTRPEIIRLSRLIPKLDQYTDHIFVHTGQNSDPRLNDIFFEDLELRKPDYYLNVDTSSMGTVMGDTIKKSEEVFLKEKPDAVMILGDTNSAIAAIVAERMHIPVYHMEAGNRSFDNNVPEELNRKMVDHVASFNLPYNDYSMRNLLNEGMHPRQIQKTGSPMAEIALYYADKISRSKIMEKLELNEKGFFLASIHRQENVDDKPRLREILGSIDTLGKDWNIPILISLHPRTQAKIKQHRLSDFKNLIFHEPFSYTDFVMLQRQSLCVISDSGTVSEESAIFGFTAISVRDSIERPEALETGTTILAGISKESIKDCVELALSSRAQTLPSGYEVEDFSTRVLSFVFSTARKHKNWLGIREISS